MGSAERKEQSLQGNVPNKRAQSQVYLNYAEHEEHLHKENVPNLRFPEFSGEWEKIKVSDLLEFYPTNSLSWEQLDYSAEGIFNLHYGLIHKGLPTQVDVSENNLPTIKDEYIPKKMSLCQNGDVAFADASEDTNDVAKCIEFANCNGQKIICGLHTIHSRDSINRTIVGFKGYAFAAPAFRQQIRRLAQGTKIYSVSSNNFAECYIGIPCKEEQSKIANLLLTVDQRIATQIKIIEKLESLIKGLYERLFNIDGAAYIQLGNVAKIQKGQQINGEKLSEIGSYYVMNGGVVPSGYLEDFNTPANTISISEGGSCGYVQYNSVPFWSGGHCYTLIEPINSFNYKYLFHYLKFKEQSIMALRIGSCLPNIQKKDLERFPILNVSKEEQDKMACIFDDILDRIICERQIALKYEEQKKYLLSNLFI